jgi:hypothetical protein
VIATIVSLSSALISKHPVDPEEPFQYLAGWTYILVAIGYSALVFWGNIFDRFTGARQIYSGFVNLSGTSSIPRFRTKLASSQVVLVHCFYLLILLCCFRTTSLALSFLPHWLTNTFDLGKSGRWSILDFGLLIFTAVLALVERRHLCSGADDT